MQNLLIVDRYIVSFLEGNFHSKASWVRVFLKSTALVSGKGVTN